MKPIIGIPTLPFRASYSDTELAALDGKELGYYWLLSRLTEKICASVSRAGGVPLLLRATNDAEEISAEAERLDGFVFTGGSDITPSLYGEENHGSISPDTERDMFEFSLMKEALPKNKPMLGICRGCQLMNVVLGGTIYQHLPDVNPEWSLHERPDVMKGYVHEADVVLPEALSLDKKITVKVNSMHHQAIDKLAPLLTAAAYSGGLTEAVALLSHKYFVGVQWHPECLSEDDEIQAGIFSALVKASA